MKPIQRGGENHRRIIEEEHVCLHPLAELIKHHFLLLFAAELSFALLPRFFRRELKGFLGGGLIEIPLVHHHDTGAAGFGDLVANLLVLLGDTLGGIQHHYREVAALDRLVGAVDAEKFNRVLNAPALPYARRVDQVVLLPDAVGFDLERYVDCVARGSGDFTDNHPLRLGKRVDDRRLAHVGSADDGDVHRRLGFRLVFLVAGFNRLSQGLRQQANRLAKRRVDTAIVQCADWEHVLETKLGKLVNPLVVPDGVHLVDDQQNRLAGLAQHPGHLEIHRHNAFMHADDEQDHVHVIERHLHLRHDFLRKIVPALLALQQANATSIYEHERPPLPLDLRTEPVARNAGAIMHDRNSSARDSIKKGRFPDIGSADDGYHSRHAGGCNRFDEPLRGGVLGIANRSVLWIMPAPDGSRRTDQGHLQVRAAPGRLQRHPRNRRHHVSASHRGQGLR